MPGRLTARLQRYAQHCGQADSSSRAGGTASTPSAVSKLRSEPYREYCVQCRTDGDYAKRIELARGYNKTKDGKHVASNVIHVDQEADDCHTGRKGDAAFSYGCAFTLDGSAIYLHGLRTVVKIAKKE